MAHPVVVAVWSESGDVWPMNASDIETGVGHGTLRARITLSPNARDVLASVGGRTRLSTEVLRPNARIEILAIVRRPPIMLRHRRFSAVVEPAEVVLATGHTLVTLPRQMLRRPKGTWQKIAFSSLEAVAGDPQAWPLCGVAAAAVAYARPPCSVCGVPSLDIDRCLCAAHLLVDALHL